MSTNNTNQCTELNNMSKGLYNTGLKTPSCPELSALNNIINNSNTSNNANDNANDTNDTNDNLNNLDNLNIFNSNLKIMDYSGGPIYILLLIAIIANIFLAIPLTPVFIAGFLYLIILILILAMLCIYLIHMLLFQEQI